MSSGADGAAAAASGRSGWRSGGGSGGVRSGAVQESSGGGPGSSDDADEAAEENEILLDRIGSSASGISGLSTKGHASISRSLTMDSFLQDIKASERYRRRRNAMHDIEFGEANEQRRTALEGSTGAAGAAAGGAATSAKGSARRQSSHALYPLTDDEAETAAASDTGT